MEELIPLLVWGFLIYVFSSGSRKKRKEQEKRRVLIEERRQRMAEAADREGEEDFGWDAPPEVGTATLEAPPAPEPYQAPPEPERRPQSMDREPQVPKDVWELIEVLARGGRPVEQQPPEPVALPAPPPPPPAPTKPRAQPAPDRPSGTRIRTQPMRSLTIKQRAEARAAAGLTAVDRVEHMDAADPGITEVDHAKHSRVEMAMAKARARRNAGRVRASRGILGMRGREGLRRAVVASEVLGRPAAMRRAEPHEPPE